MDTLTKTIRVDEDVIKYLEKNVRGFETPNIVLRRLLKIDKALAKKTVTAKQT